MAKVSQLRIYNITPGKMEDFIKLWRDKVSPVRVQYGFTIDAGWRVEGEDKFVWIVSYDGDLTWDEALDIYMKSPERAAISPDPSTYTDSMVTYFITPEPRYTPDATP